MNTILIKSITIADPAGPLDGKKLDLLIRNGRIEAAKSGINETADIVVEGDGKYISVGWMDCYAHCGEPGEEWKEDLASLAAAGAAGGFTEIAAFCGTHPFPDSAPAITSVYRKGQGLKANILPLGTATKGREGKEIAEMFDMKQAGAVAFTDGESPIPQAGLKSRIMEYAKNSGAIYLDFPFDKSIAAGGLMHDGVQSNSMGLKGIPVVSEQNPVAEAIALAKWLKAPLRLFGISSAESVALIRNAQKEGVEIYAAVPVMNLLFTDKNLDGFDENFKVWPPLRGESDRAALLEGLKDGTICAVYSNHNAQDAENKNVEFDYAAFGAIAIQSAFSMLVAAFDGKCSAKDVALYLQQGAAKFLGREQKHIAEGTASSLTIFDLEGSWVWNESSNKSKSKNSAWLGREMKGSIVGTICNGVWNANNHSAAAK